jgi:hypothetical protein
VHENLKFLCLKKCHLFSFTKLEDWWAEQVLSGELVSVGLGEEVGKGCGRVNMAQILCTHVCK